MVALARRLVSEAEFLALPESVERVELVDGEVILAPAPSYEHQELQGRIYVALREWVERTATRATVIQAPIDLRLAPNRIVQPDVLLILERLPRSHRGPIERIPELCAEIVSTDRVYDRVTKRLLYAAAGVREYWVVEPGGLIERWEGPGLAKAEEVRERLSSPLLPGFDLDVTRLFSFEVD